MNDDTQRLAELTAAADLAYQRARVEIEAAVPAGARIDPDILTPRQRVAFDDLIVAEAELANYRQQAHPTVH